MNTKSRSTLEKLKEKMSFKNYSKRTIEVYIHYAGVFLSNFNKDPYHISVKESELFLLRYKYTSSSQQNQFISAIKLLYKYVIGRKLSIKNIERPRKEKHLPKVINHEKIISSINSITNFKHKAILSIAYSAGLRVSEIINLKINDFDTDNMIIYIRQAKGRKDRVVPLSDNIRLLLIDYLEEYYQEGQEYLFVGQFKEKYSPNSCNKIVKKYIGKNYHIHQLRHSCMTHLLENGTDLRIIQKLAGHNSSKTTEIYAHVSTRLLNSINLPV